MEDKCPNCGAPNNDYLDGFWLCGSIKSMPDDQNGHGTTCLIHQLTARDEELAALKAVLGRVRAWANERAAVDPRLRDRFNRLDTILSDIQAPLAVEDGWTDMNTTDAPNPEWYDDQINVWCNQQGTGCPTPVTVVVLPNKQGGEDENTKRDGA